MKTEFEFFLGGNDKETIEIKKIVEAAGYVVHDKGLGWGAKASAYKEEMERILRHNRMFRDVPMDCLQSSGALSHTPIVGVCVELEKDFNEGMWHDSTWPLHCSCDFYSIDHHGSRAGEPPAIQQVADLLGVKLNRRQTLIGAMDAAYIYGLKSIGAKPEEIRGFLGASEAETIGEMLIETENHPEEVIREAERAVAAATHIGSLIVVECGHNICAPVTARLFDEQEEQNILILSEWTENGEKKTEANYYASGEKVSSVLAEIDGWSGGTGLTKPTKKAEEFWTQFGGYAPNTAFWGCEGEHPGKVLKAVQDC